MRTLGGRRRIRAVGALLAAASVTAVGCGGDSNAASEAPMAVHFRTVMFSVSPVSAYSAAVEHGARKRAAELGVVLDVVRAQTGTAQVQQMLDAVGSGQFIGGLLLPLAHDELCEVSTNLAPDNNFMLAVADTPICGREAGEGDVTWAPGTLTFVSAGQELSDLTRWGEHLRAANPGRQQVVLLTADPSAGLSRNAAAALATVERKNPRFKVVRTVHTDGTEQDATAKLSSVLRAHPDITIITSLRAELTKATTEVLARQANDGVRVYDLGGSTDVLKLIERGRVQMTLPQYPQTMGATAVQALYDARVGRTPIPRYHAAGGRTTAFGPAAERLLFVTKKNLEQFRAAALREY